MLWTAPSGEVLSIDTTSNFNEGAPILQAGSSFLWWMWHGETGHWVLNDTPGSHGNDITKSELGPWMCPKEADFIKGHKIECFDSTTTATSTTSTTTSTTTTAIT